MYVSLVQKIIIFIIINVDFWQKAQQVLIIKIKSFKQISIKKVSASRGYLPRKVLLLTNLNILNVLTVELEPT